MSYFLKSQNKFEEEPIPNLNYLYPLFFLALILISLVSILTLDTVGGDASIYFSFSKNFWQLPYSFREGGEVLHGATSPFWVVYLALFNENFVALKVVNIALLVVSFLFLIRTKVQYILVPILLLFSERFIYMNALVYEVALLFPFLCIFLVATLDKSDDYSILVPSVCLGLMIGIRPEAIMLSPLLMFRAYEQKTFALPFLFVLGPISLYSIYMYIMTGDALPASIVQRLIRHGVGSDGLFEWVPRIGKIIINFNDNLVFFIISFLTFFLGFKYKKIYAVLALTLTLFLFFLVVSESARWRYFLITDILCAFSISFVIFKSLQKTSFNPSILIVGSFLFFAGIFGKFIEETAKFFTREGEGASSTFKIRFAEDLDQALESLKAKKSARVLIYTIETQYGSKREYISLEGIISNFPISFNSIQDFHDHVAELDYYVSGHACGMDKFAGSFHEDICKAEDGNIAIGYTYKNDSFSLELVHINDDPGYKMWNGVYKIVDNRKP